MIPLKQPHFWGLRSISLSSCSGETEDWGSVLMHTERPALSLGHLDLRRTETFLRDSAGEAGLARLHRPQPHPRRETPASPKTRKPIVNLP